MSTATAQPPVAPAAVKTDVSLKDRGNLFEIATDAPGFAIDEPIESLGTTLKLPAQFEPHRAEITAALAPLPL